MNDIKIIVTAAPRSGHAWLTYLLNRILLSSKYASKKSNVERNNTPLMLYGKFDNAIQTTILRKPEEIIPSNLSKLFAGFGNNYSGNIIHAHEVDNEFLNLTDMTHQQIYQYQVWLNAINRNLDRIVPFTFEQITQNPDYICKYFIEYYNLNDIILENLNFNDLLLDAKSNIKQHIKIQQNYSNAFPVNAKPEFYYESKTFLLNHEKYQEILDLYNITLNNIMSFHFK
jgi:hypothetical protein